jgi:general secretion pathway protein K
MPDQFTGNRRSGERGFALVLVIWGLGLLSLIAVTVITAERYRILAAANLIENAKAEALAEAGVNLVRLELVSALAGASSGKFRFVTTGAPLLCNMPNGVPAALAIEDEGGKVDLNAASPKLMSALLRGFGAGFDQADRLAAAIAEFSRPSTDAVLDEAAFRAYAADGRNYGPKKGPFESVLELDQVVGMRPDLLRSILPYVTVYSRKSGVDPRVAAPALLAALAGDDPARVAQLVGASGSDGAREAAIRGVPSEFLVPSASRSFLVHAEVRTPAGGTFAQEAVVDLTAGETPDVLREWRRGDSRFGGRLNPSAHETGGERLWPAC